MNFIVHLPFSGVAANGDFINLARSDTFNSVGYFIAANNEAICRIGSDMAHKHFALNDDGNGLERGKLSYIIAFIHHFSEIEAEYIQSNYSHFLKDSDALIFNDDFFNTDIETLQTIADNLHLDEDLYRYLIFINSE